MSDNNRHHSPFAIEVLGPMRAWLGGVECELPTQKPRSLLALLLARHGRPVSVEEILRVVWSDSPPDSGVNLVQKYIGQLRRFLEKVFGEVLAGGQPERHASGYRLRLDENQVDLLRFRSIVAAVSADTEDAGLTQLIRALRLWRGPSFGGLAATARTQPVFDAVDSEYVDAAIRAARFGAGSGRLGDVVPVLQPAVAFRPLDEAVHAWWVRALAAAGRQAEALAAYDVIRQRLVEELGIDPGPELQDARQRVLRQQDRSVSPSRPSSLDVGTLLVHHRRRRGLSQRDLARVSAVGVHVVRDLERGQVAHVGHEVLEALAAGLELNNVDRVTLIHAAPRPPSVTTAIGEIRQDNGVPSPPRQLPLPARPFIGRDKEMAALWTYANEPGAHAVLITGMPGTGKTALAVRFATDAADRFPDGQIYLDLGGFGVAKPVDTAEAMGRLLRSLGVEPAAIPDSIDEATVLLRSLTANRRLLILLDNAWSAAATRPLLPTGAGCLSLITSRRNLDSLFVRDGATLVHLDVLPDNAATSLLAAVIGTDRVAAEPEAATALARLCGGLPLALRIVAATLSTRARPSVATVVQRIGGPRGIRQLTASDGEEAVWVAFEHSRQQLVPAGQELFARLGAAPGPDIALTTVAAMQGQSEPDAAALIDQLVVNNLIEHYAADRYRMHDLLRSYAGELAKPTDIGIQRLLDYYRDTADAASRTLVPQFLRLPATATPVRGRPAFHDETTALRWLESERANLLAIVAQSDRLGRPELSWHIVDSMRALFWHRKYYHDWFWSTHTALDIARKQNEVTAQAAMLLSLATLSWSRADYPEANRQYKAAHDLARSANWLEAVSAALANLAGVMRNLGRLDAASAYYEQLLREGPTDSSGRGEATTLGNIASLALDQGDLPKCFASAQRALVHYVNTGSLQGQARQLQTLGLAHLISGAIPAAQRSLRLALHRHQTVGSRDGEADCLDKLARLAVRRGRLSAGLTRAEHALALSREVADRATEVEAMTTLAIAELLSGHTANATRLCRQAVTVARDIGYRSGEIEARTALAEATAAAGDVPAALTYARRAQQTARMAGYGMLAARTSALIDMLRRGRRIRRPNPVTPGAHQASSGRWKPANAGRPRQIRTRDPLNWYFDMSHGTHAGTAPERRQEVVRGSQGLP